MSQEPESLVETLRTEFGPDTIITDDGVRARFANDLAYEGTPPLAVAAPVTVEQLQAVVRTAASRGIPFAPVGGATSYSRGYLPDTESWIAIDTRRLDRVVEINALDGYVTAEAGCRWDTLLAELAPDGLRPPAWGPYSGRYATLGGTIAQNAAFYGAARYGTVAEGVLGLTIVLPDGTLLETGAAAFRSHTYSFFRHVGPDLTGLFVGSCGAFGVIARVTLRLVPVPRAVKARGYHLGGPVAVADAMREIAQSAAASECMCFTGSGEDAVDSSARYLLSTVHEGDTEDLADRDAVRTDEIVARVGGRIAGSSPFEKLRSTPFPDLATIVGPGGTRWLPLHVIVPHTLHLATLRAIDDFMHARTAALTASGFAWTCVSMLIGRTAVLVEPGLYWPDEPSRAARTLLDPDTRSLATHGAQPQLRAAILRLRSDLIAHLTDAGGVSMQIGRAYPYCEQLAQSNRILLESLKDLFDPGGLANRGVLGLYGRPPTR